MFGNNISIALFLNHPLIIPFLYDFADERGQYTGGDSDYPYKCPADNRTDKGNHGNYNKPVQ